MVLAGFQYEPAKLDVNEVCFEEEQVIPKMHEKSRKSKCVTEWCRCGKWGVTQKSVEYMSCSEVAASEYF